MILRKITIENSVRYIPITEKTKEKEIKPKTRKASSLLRKQKKIFHKTTKISIKMWQQVDLGNLQNIICTVTLIIIILIFVYE